MKARAEKAVAKQSKAVAGASPARQLKQESEVQFEDRRSEAVGQRALEGKADSSPQAGIIAQLQAIADSSAAGTIQRLGFDEEEALQGKFETIQRQGAEQEEELLQGKFEAIQRQSLDEEEIQAKSATLQKKDEKPANNTGLPDGLKLGIENLSGFSLDDVKVHYNSPKPAQLQAHAFAQGTDIHMAPGQEKHLPHETWHVVQQKQGRVKPTLQLKGNIDVNDDEGLEKDADVMGNKALETEQSVFLPAANAERETGDSIQARATTPGHKTGKNVIQPKWTHAEVTKKSGAALHKYEQGKAGEVSVKKGGWFGGGKLLTVQKGEVLWVDPERQAGNYVYGMHPLHGDKQKRGYINESNFKILQWEKDADLAAALLDGYLNTHKVQQHIEEKAEFQESTRKGMAGLFAAIKQNRDKGAAGFFDRGKIIDPMENIEHWMEMGKELKGRQQGDEGGLIPMTCDQSTAIIISTLAESLAFKSSLTVIKQGDPKQHGHWYVLANRSPDAAAPKYGESLRPGEFIIDIWGSLRMKEDDPGVDTVVHRTGANAVFDASVISEDQSARGEQYVKEKIAEQNRLKVMLNVEAK